MKTHSKESGSLQPKACQSLLRSSAFSQLFSHDLTKTCSPKPMTSIQSTTGTSNRYCEGGALNPTQIQQRGEASMNKPSDKKWPEDRCQSNGPARKDIWARSLETRRTSAINRNMSPHLHKMMKLIVTLTPPPFQRFQRGIHRLRANPSTLEATQNP